MKIPDLTTPGFVDIGVKTLRHELPKTLGIIAVMSALVAMFSGNTILGDGSVIMIRHSCSRAWRQPGTLSADLADSFLSVTVCFSRSARSLSRTSI